MTLAERLLELHRSLADEDIPHAFGGAIALAYWTLDPRGTSDIDVKSSWRPRKRGRPSALRPAGAARVTAHS